MSGNEELVKRLRDISNSDSDIKSNYIGLTMIQAADAIEELSTQIKNWEDALKTALDYIPCWVSVTERLPEGSGVYLVYDSCGNTFRNFFGTEIKKWSIRNGMITHWMPLPPAPKPSKDEAPAGPYDLLYEEGGANTT